MCERKESAGYFRAGPENLRLEAAGDAGTRLCAWNDSQRTSATRTMARQN